MTSPDPSERLRQILQSNKSTEEKPLVQVGPPEREVLIQIATAGLPGGCVALEIIGPDAQVMVQVHADGTITYGPNYQPDEAAKIFWGAMAVHMERNVSIASPDEAGS